MLSAGQWEGLVACTNTCYSCRDDSLLGDLPQPEITSEKVGQTKTKCVYHVLSSHIDKQFSTAL